MMFYPRPQVFNFKVLDYEFSGHVSEVALVNGVPTAYFDAVLTDVPPAGIEYMGGHLFQNSNGIWTFWEK